MGDGGVLCFSWLWSGSGVNLTWARKRAHKYRLQTMEEGGLQRHGCFLQHAIMQSILSLSISFVISRLLFFLFFPFSTASKGAQDIFLSFVRLRHVPWNWGGGRPNGGRFHRCPTPKALAP